MWDLFSTSGFMPHGHCYLWNPWLVGINVVSDSLTAVAYTTIPFTLFYFVRKRGQTPFNWIFICFATFIIACGAMHLLEVYTLWVPAYWLLGATKAVTALASVPTAVLLVKLVPRALSMPTADRMSAVLEELREAKAVLEERVRARTEELTLKNEQLANEIRQKELASAAMRSSEAKLQRLAEAGAIGLLTSGFDGRIFEANEQFLRLLGYTQNDLEHDKLNWKSLTPPEYLEGSLAAVEELRRTGVAAAREKDYLRSDGSRVPVLVGATMLDSERAVTFVLDLSQQKKAAAELASLKRQTAEDAKFKALLESAPDAMVIVEVNGEISLINGQTENLFGYRREELIGRNINLLVPDRYQDVYAANRQSSLAGPSSGDTLELRLLRKDRTEFPVEVSLSPLQTDEGLLVSSAIRDVSVRRLTEAALRTSNRELEAFSYSVAHDLRTPLRGIHGFAQLLDEELALPNDSPSRKFLTKILENSLHMAALIDALLALARVSRSELTLSRVDLSAAVRAVADSLRHAEPQRVVNFVIQDALSAQSDPTLVTLLLENLINNAWKFSRNATPARIEFGVKSVDGQRTFFVADNGAGFDMAYSTKLFSAFQRLHSPREYPGTGIGLATCHRIIERHGGRIWAEARVDEGATFYFSLPESVDE